MKVRKMNAHRARLSFEKPTGWVRKANKRGKPVLVAWKRKRRTSLFYPYQTALLEMLRRFEGAVYIPRRTGMASVFAALYGTPQQPLYIDPRKDPA